MLEPGSEIGEYIIEKKLGQGGMAQVWLGRHKDLHLLRAIKIMDSAEPWDEETRKRFLLEGREQSKLNHPAIVKVIDYGETPGEPIAFLVLEYIGRVLVRAVETDRQRVAATKGV